MDSRDEEDKRRNLEVRLDEDNTDFTDGKWISQKDGKLAEKTSSGRSSGKII